jgi:hypothetical protein
MKFTLSLLSALALPSLIAAQLSGTVGPLTSRSAKAATKVCNILNYGGTASATTDNSAAIASAWAACVDGGEGLKEYTPDRISLLTFESLHSFRKLWLGELGHTHWWECYFHQPRRSYLPHWVSCSFMIDQLDVKVSLGRREEI